MKQYLPGTTVETELSRPDAADALLSPLFLTGGLTRSQVVQLTGLETHTIQNWVKRGFLSPPQHKKYSRRQFCRILIINMLKDALQLDKICKLLSYFNGSLSDESDDLIDDSYLYTCIVRLVGRLEGEAMPDTAELEQWCSDALDGYGEPCPGARTRVSRSMAVILTALMAARYRQEAESLLAELDAPAVLK